MTFFKTGKDFSIRIMWWKPGGHKSLWGRQRHCVDTVIICVIYADHTDDQTAGYVFSAHLLRQPQTDKMMIISKTWTDRSSDMDLSLCCWMSLCHLCCMLKNNAMETENTPFESRNPKQVVFPTGTALTFSLTLLYVSSSIWKMDYAEKTELGLKVYCFIKYSSCVSCFKK